MLRETPLLLLLALTVVRPLHAQPGWVRRYQERVTRYTEQQPRWAGPVFTTTAMLSSVVREDAAHQESPGGHLWNVGVGKGLELVPLPRIEFIVTVPPYIVRADGGHNGFGDAFGAIKVRLLGRPEGKGNYILTALLNSTVPTGTDRNGAPAATFTPQVLGGKGWGRFDQVLSLAATLPAHDAAENGRTIVANTATQFHALRYFWPMIESSTTAWFGSARDGEVQSMLGPSFVIGRLPYTRNEHDRRRGISFGAGYLVAITHVHSTDHLLQLSTRFHF